MIEPRWEVKIGSTVMASDGEYGYLQELLADPHQERIVALLVRPLGLMTAPMVVVPEEYIADASEGEVRLAIRRIQVDALPKYLPESAMIVEDQKYESDDEMFAVREESRVEVGRAPSSRKPGMIENQLSLSEGEHLGLRLRAGQQVYCQDGYAGQVSLHLSGPKGQVRGIVLQTGHLPLAGHQLIVPAAWVIGVDPQKFHLSASRNDLKSLPIYCPDADLLEKVDQALWSDDILQFTDYNKISASVQDGIVTIRGHVITVVSKTRIENAVRSVAGVLDVQNNVVIDQDLAIAVAQALGNNEIARAEHILVKAENGIIQLNGWVGSAAIRDAAEALAASIPQVRGVINDLKAPEVVVDLEEQHFRQPLIGREVSAVDMVLGQVERVIINPHNRLVTAFVTRGYFPKSWDRSHYHQPSDDDQEERRVVIPISSVRYLSDNSVLLSENGADTALHPDFSPAVFIYPPVDWQPPFPYRWEEVLFEKNE